MFAYKWTNYEWLYFSLRKELEKNEGKMKKDIESLKHGITKLTPIQLIMAKKSAYVHPNYDDYKEDFSEYRY